MKGYNQEVPTINLLSFTHPTWVINHASNSLHRFVSSQLAKIVFVTPSNDLVISSTPTVNMCVCELFTNLAKTYQLSIHINTYQFNTIQYQCFLRNPPFRKKVQVAHWRHHFRTLKQVAQHLRPRQSFAPVACLGRRATSGTVDGELASESRATTAQPAPWLRKVR